MTDISDNREPLGATTSEFPATPKLGIGTAGAPPQEVRELLQALRDAIRDSGASNDVRLYARFARLVADAFEALLAERDRLRELAEFRKVDAGEIQKLIAENAVLRTTIDQWVEGEAAACPEDWGFPEYVKHLEAKNAELRKNALTENARGFTMAHEKVLSEAVRVYGNLKTVSFGLSTEGRLLEEAMSIIAAIVELELCPTCLYSRDADVLCSDAFHIAPAALPLEELPGGNREALWSETVFTLSPELLRGIKTGP